MCGIIGALGQHEVAPILLEALKRLEYRGYDSGGIATLNGGLLERRRAIGKLHNLSDLLVHRPLMGKSGIGHTRWATHGAPNLQNAHPHFAGTVGLVHNGIIENFVDLREELAGYGFSPTSDTDTETVAMLTQHHILNGSSPIEAVDKTLAALRGTFALVFLFQGEEDLMIAARKGSPLAIGYGDSEMFVGSDAIALAPLTDRICYLEEGDRAVLRRSHVDITDANGKTVNREISHIQFDSARVNKVGYKYFMAKEIAEQPSMLHNLLNAYLAADAQKIMLPNKMPDFSKIERITMIACGTAYYACVTAKYWFEKIAQIPVEVDIASEFRYREPPITGGTMALFVSQSGETADTLAALRYCKGKADHIISVTNVAQSSIVRESELSLPIHAGIEIGVASTKAFTCQLTVLLITALSAAHQRNALTTKDLLQLLRDLKGLPGIFNTAMSMTQSITDVANYVSKARDILFLGRDLMYPIALEGALKLKEISYIHAEGYASGELKHGPIALLDEQVPVVIIAPSNALFEKSVSNMQEVMARGAKVILITDSAGAVAVNDATEYCVILPQINPVLAPILYSLPMQLLAYHTGIAKGTDVDQPRNLAKSVTVE
ncbi:MAG: glutamine--fructose-6-phosphate transaminase (isomerizing) [Paracoccaceae bacterium]|nr:glutamine--fructose-6-phosphate transaminase (isomerizing) [Paracoccaceae bacterium]